MGLNLKERPTYRRAKRKNGNDKAYIRFHYWKDDETKVQHPDVYFGNYNSDESLAAYQKWCSENVGASDDFSESVLMQTALEEYLLTINSSFKQSYCEPRRLGVKLLAPWAKLPVKDFRKKHMTEIRENLSKLPRALSTQNRKLKYIREFFQWCSEKDYCTGSKLADINSVRLIMKGENQILPRKQRKAVNLEHVKQTVEHLSPTLRTMVMLQMFTGMRSGNLVDLENRLIDRTGNVWVYVPEHHKADDKFELRISIIKPAQVLLQEYIESRPKLKRKSRYLFPAFESYAWYKARHSEKETSLVDDKKGSTGWQMRQHVKANPEAKNWKCTKWVELLGVNRSTICQTMAWHEFKTEREPKYQKRGERAVIRYKIAGETTYKSLGRYDSEISRERYAEELKTWRNKLPAVAQRQRRKAKTISQIKIPTRVRDKFDASSYRKALAKAQTLAGVPDWTPHELRHAMASIIDRNYGIEAAQAFLGHKTIQVTREYAGQNHELCLKVAEKLNLSFPS